MPTDAERIRRIANGWGLNDFRRTHLETMVSDALAAVRAESSAEIDRLRQRCGELERERDELQMRNDAQAYTIGSLQREWNAKNDAYNRAVEKRAEAAERERDVAAARMEYYKARDDEGAVIQKELEARLAQARSTIETAMADLQAALADGSGLDRIMGQLECAVACCDGELLARDTGTGGEQP
jgi:chromosome segregation ATPase